MVLPLCDVLDKLVLNYTGMLDVNVSNEAGSTIPAFEAQCRLATGQQIDDPRTLSL